MKPVGLFFGLTLLLLLGNTSSAQPTNDLFADRTILVGTNVTISGSNSGADTEAGEDTGGGVVLWFYSVWYSWTAPTNGVVQLSGSTAVWHFIMSIRAYRGSAVNALTLAATTPDGGVPVTAGDTIAIQVASIYYPLAGGVYGKGAFTLTLSLETPSPPSPNDDFANRLEITTPAYHFEGSIYGAASEPGEPLPFGTSQTLWWRFVAPEAGVLTLSPSAPQFTPALTLYRGTNLGSLIVVPYLNSYRYRLQAGTEYELQMATGVVPVGAFTLDAQFFSFTNDFYSGSTQLEGTNVTYVANMTTATIEPGEPNPGYSNTVWVSWVAPFTGRGRYTRSVVSWAQPVIIYTGPTLNLLTPVRTVYVPNWYMDFLAIEGTVYHFQISGLEDECNFSLQLLPWNAPINDDFANARWMAGQDVNSGLYPEWFPIGEATAELGEPAHLDGTPFKSLWWKWTAPVHGTARFYSDQSVATNIVLAVYKGNTVEALSLLAKGNDEVSFGVTGGDDYCIAAAVPTNAIGDVLVHGGVYFQSSASRPVPGNLLREPSWEGTSLFEAQYWGMSGSVGGSVGEQGGADGTTWPTLGGGGRIWQDFSTIPWKSYSIRFAMRTSGYVSTNICDGQVRVLWDNQEIGVGVLPEAEIGFWHWEEFTAVAHYPTSRITFVNIGCTLSDMDAFSVVALAEPPKIVTQPVSASVISGGTAAFIAGASGSSPLTYYWSFNDAPYAALRGPVLILDPVSTNQAGTYQAVVSNAFGMATSAPVTLTVEAPTQPVILWQPYGDTVGVGGYFSPSVVAAGTSPLSYQWFKDNVTLEGATNRVLTFTSVDYTNAGVYAVRVENNAGVVWSLNARLEVADALYGGGKVAFANMLFDVTNIDAPVFDIDTVTRLNGSNYLAQLYGGPSLELIRPVGEPRPFWSGFEAGYFTPQIVTIPAVPPGSNAVLQVRAWDGNSGSSYEEARALGGKFGKSDLLTLPVGGGLLPPAILQGLKSFSLQAGMSQFSRGRISFVEEQPGGILVWSHQGEPGFRYVIEKSEQGFEWRPYLVVTNVTSNVTFTDSPNGGAAFYRSRILD